jgi:hypothetical protein
MKSACEARQAIEEVVERGPFEAGWQSLSRLSAAGVVRGPQVRCLRALGGVLGAGRRSAASGAPATCQAPRRGWHRGSSLVSRGTPSRVAARSRGRRQTSLLRRRAARRLSDPGWFRRRASVGASSALAAPTVFLTSRRARRSRSATSGRTGAPSVLAMSLAGRAARGVQRQVRAEPMLRDDALVAEQSPLRRSLSASSSTRSLLSASATCVQPLCNSSSTASSHASLIHASLIDASSISGEDAAVARSAMSGSLL